MERIIRYFKYLRELVLYFVLLPASLIYNKNREVYLVSERGTDARDNGYHFFKYLRRQHPEIEAYYVIDKNSPDYDKVARFGKTLQWKSMRHRFIFIGAKYKISTHIMGFSPNIDFYNKMNEVFPLVGKKIFLQHGIIKDDLPQLYEEKTKLDMFVCGAKPEYDFIRSKFHYKNGEVKYTGLARYDALSNYSTENQILIMPTWRMYFNNQTNEEIEQSVYVKAWNDILSNERLIEKLKERNLTLFFYPHYEMQKHISLFKSSSDHVVIADFASYDVQDLLKKSKLLITDYSSVFFDFAYMMKPCIYYQFDLNEFTEHHYGRGYFNYEKDGFGRVVSDSETLIEEIIKIINRNYELEERYRGNICRFFQKHDTNNCQRIFEEICKL